MAGLLIVGPALRFLGAYEEAHSLAASLFVCALVFPLASCSRGAPIFLLLVLAFLFLSPLGVLGFPRWSLRGGQTGFRFGKAFARGPATGSPSVHLKNSPKPLGTKIKVVGKDRLSPRYFLPEVRKLF